MEFSLKCLFLGNEDKPDKSSLHNNTHKYLSPQVHKRQTKANRLITAKFNSFDTGDAGFPPPSSTTAASANSSRPTTAGRSRPPTAGRSRPTTASKSRPTTAGKSRPTTSENFQDYKPPVTSTSNVSSSATADRPKSGARPLTGSRPQSSRRSIASRKGIVCLWWTAFFPIFLKDQSFI